MMPMLRRFVVDAPEIRLGRGAREYFHWVDRSGTTRWNGRDELLRDEQRTKDHL